MHPEVNLEAIEVTVTALLSLANNATAAATVKIPENRDSDFSKLNYPDLVPRSDLVSGKLSLNRDEPTPNDFGEGGTGGASVAIAPSSGTVGPMSETFFLLAILLGTCILLYFFPAEP